VSAIGKRSLPPIDYRVQIAGKSQTAHGRRPLAAEVHGSFRDGGSSPAGRPLVR